MGAQAPALPFLVSAFPIPVYVMARSSAYEMTGIGVGSPDGESVSLTAAVRKTTALLAAGQSDAYTQPRVYTATGYAGRWRGG